MLISGGVDSFRQTENRGEIKNKALSPSLERGSKELYIHATRNLNTLRIDPPGIFST